MPTDEQLWYRMMSESSKKDPLIEARKKAQQEDIEAAKAEEQSFTSKVGEMLTPPKPKAPQVDLAKVAEGTSQIPAISEVKEEEFEPLEVTPTAEDMQYAAQQRLQQFDLQKQLTPEDPKKAAQIAGIVGEIAVGSTPAGIAIDIKDMAKAVETKDPILAAMAGIGFIPSIGDAAKGTFKALRAGDRSAETLAAGRKMLEDLPESATEAARVISAPEAPRAPAARAARVIDDSGFSLAADKSKAVFRIDSTNADGQIRYVVVVTMPDGSSKAFLRSTGTTDPSKGTRGVWIPFEGFATSNKWDPQWNFDDVPTATVALKTFWGNKYETARAPAGTALDEASKWIDKYIDAKGGDEAVFGGSRTIVTGASGAKGVGTTTALERKNLGRVNKFLNSLGAIDHNAIGLKVAGGERRMLFGFDYSPSAAKASVEAAPEATTPSTQLSSLRK